MAGVGQLDQFRTSNTVRDGVAGRRGADPVVAPDQHQGGDGDLAQPRPHVVGGRKRPEEVAGDVGLEAAEGEQSSGDVQVARSGVERPDVSAERLEGGR